MKKRHEDSGLLLEWYHRGSRDMERGRPFSPPDNRLYTHAYAMGWEDEINGAYTHEDDLYDLLLG